MAHEKILFFLFLLCIMSVSLISAEKYKILMLLPMAGKSHKNVFEPLMAGLATHGHDVTVVSPFRPAKTIPNLKEYAIDEIREGMEENQKVVFSNTISGGTFTLMSSFSELTLKACEIYLNQSVTKEMLKKGKIYDLVIVQAVMNDCALVVATLIGRTIMYLNPAIVPTMDATLRMPSSLRPSIMSGLPTKMNFFQRLQNVVYDESANILFNHVLTSGLQSFLSEALPQAPTIKEAKSRIALYLYNADPVLVALHPGITNVVAVGAMHCKDAQPLPKDFEDFIQSSGEDGFIYFSLGSNAPSKYLPEETRQAFLTAFSRLKQKVIWKFEEELPGKPANVMTTKWAPQQDILGHPKIRLFITHGGMLSLQETLYHGVPVVGIALFGDQPTNVVRVQELQLGEGLDFKNVTAELIYNAVTKVLNDQSYAINMRKYSAILRDQPQKPLDRAIFWTEYVIRHNGAAHLRSVGQDLNFFQYYLIDVFALLFLLVAIATFGLAKGTKTVLRYVRRHSTRAATKKTQ